MDEATLKIMRMFLEGAIVLGTAIATSVSIGVWGQIQHSDRAIVRLETQIVTLEQTLSSFKSADRDLAVVESKIDELSRRVNHLEDQ